MPADFASRFEEQYRLIYARSVRRIRDKRDRLSPETLAFLNHLSFSGPLSPGEISLHIGRAPSTVSEMTDHLVKKGLIERDTDPADARRVLIWLTKKGREAIVEAERVLDRDRLLVAGAAMSGQERQRLLHLLQKLANGLARQKPKKKGKTDE